MENTAEKWQKHKLEWVLAKVLKGKYESGLYKYYY